MSESPLPYEEVEHTADLALRVWGADLGELFRNAAMGMFHFIYPEGPGALDERLPVEIEAPDAESLLVDWLNELLYLSEVHDRSLGRFEITHMGETELRAVALGGPSPHRAKEIKAATFHNLEITRHQGGYSATIVFDV